MLIIFTLFFDYMIRFFIDDVSPSAAFRHSRARVSFIFAGLPLLIFMPPLFFADAIPSAIRFVIFAALRLPPLMLCAVRQRMLLLLPLCVFFFFFLRLRLPFRARYRRLPIFRCSLLFTMPCCCRR